jgi:hypothetical protein
MACVRTPHMLADSRSMLVLLLLLLVLNALR